MNVLIQLKPLQESFYTFVFQRLRKLEAVILCEGVTEVEIVKEIVRKLGIELGVAMGVTDCEGIDNVPRVVIAIVTLTKLARKLRKIGVIVDAEDLDLESRARNIVNSLRARGLSADELRQVGRCSQVYVTRVGVDRNRLMLAIAINGDFSLPLKKHAIEDHAVKLLLLEGRIDMKVVSMCEDAKQIIRSRREIIELVRQSSRENVENAFTHIHRLLSLISQNYSNKLSNN